jgi:hypothetical protein
LSAENNSLSAQFWLVEDVDLTMCVGSFHKRQAPLQSSRDILESKTGRFLQNNDTMLKVEGSG